MRARTAAILVVLLTCFATIHVFSSLAHARSVTFAQDSGKSDSGQSDADAESGASKGEKESGTSTEEEGPPWTYQMARIGLGLLVLMGAGLGLLYYRMIVSRSRGVA